MYVSFITTVIIHLRLFDHFIQQFNMFNLKQINNESYCFSTNIAIDYLNQIIHYKRIMFMLSLLIFWMCLGCVPGGEWVGVYIPLCTCWGQRTISISQFSSSTLFNWDGVSFCRSVERNRVAGFRTSGDSTVSALNLVAGVLTDEPWTLWAQTLTLKQWVLTLLVQLATLKELPSSSPWLLLEQTRKNFSFLRSSTRAIYWGRNHQKIINHVKVEYVFNNGSISVEITFSFYISLIFIELYS